MDFRFQENSEVYLDPNGRAAYLADGVQALIFAATGA